MSTLIKTTTLALATAMLAFGAGSVVTSTEAQAKKIHVVGSGHHHRHHHYRVVYLTSSFVGSGCGYSYSRWQDTGSFYWKKRYYECRGWW